LNTLITGWNGFLGSHLCRAVESSCSKVVRCGRTTDSDIRCDLSEEAPVIPSTINRIIHSAGVAHKSQAEQTDRNLYQRGNVDTTSNLLSALNPSTINSFTLISSVSVYGRQEGMQITENMEPRPLTEYAKSKLDAEILVSTWCSANNIACSIIRPPLIVGANAPGSLNKLIKAIKSRRFVLPGSGNARRSMVLANDIADWIADSPTINGTFNLTDQLDPSYKELCDQITDQLQIKPISSVPNSAMATVGFFGDMAAKILGRPMPYGLEVHNQMTKSLTFSSDFAAKHNWTPNSVLQNCDSWIS